jgi:O-acetyl-ADP-ribose deacetylase (regulator of RNase III)
MNKESIHLAIGSLLDSPAEAIANEVNEDLIFSDDAFSSLGSKAPDATVLECLRIGQIKIGTAAVTTAGNLPAKHIVHVATCGFDGHSTEQHIIEALRDGLNKAKEKGIKSIALPEIGRRSSDIPLKRLAELLLSECLRHNDRDVTLETVYFRLTDRRSLEVFSECLRHV